MTRKLNTNASEQATASEPVAKNIACDLIAAHIKEFTDVDAFGIHWNQHSYEMLASRVFGICSAMSDKLSRAWNNSGGCADDYVRNLRKIIAA